MVFLKGYQVAGGHEATPSRLSGLSRPHIPVARVVGGGGEYEGKSWQKGTGGWGGAETPKEKTWKFEVFFPYGYQYQSHL